MSEQVFIIGGGPAGAATALQLTALGIPVTVIEARTEAIMKPGETIPPQAEDVFNRLGIRALLADPAHIACYGNRIIWGQGQPADRIFYFHTRPQGWHLHRQVFETQLTVTAIDRGVTYLHGCSMQSAVPTADGWMVTVVDQRQQIRVLPCRFLVDATGRSCRVARSLGIQRRTLDKLTGLYTVIPYSGRLQQYTYIEAVANGWWYMAPLSSQQLVITFMSDADTLPDTARKAAGFSRLFSETRLLRDTLSSLPAEGLPAPAVHHAATGYLSHRQGKNWLAAGDAAFAYDPISSHGIISALEGGYYAGHAIATYLSGNDAALDAYDWAISETFSAYMRMHADQYALEQRWPDAIFWARRGRMVPES